MADDWKSWSYRQKVILQLEDIIRQSPTSNQRNAHEIELQVFQRATKKEEYVQLMTRIMMHMQEVAQSNTQANNNPHIPEILTRHPGPSQISGPNPPMMNNAMNMQGSPRIGQPMPANLPTQGGEMGSWPGNNRRIGEMQISGVGKKTASFSHVPARWSAGQDDTDSDANGCSDGRNHTNGPSGWTWSCCHHAASGSLPGLSTAGDSNSNQCFPCTLTISGQQPGVPGICQSLTFLKHGFLSCWNW